MLVLMQPQTSNSLPGGYDFLQTPTPQKSGFLTGNSKRKRMLIVGIGVLLLVIIASVMISVFQNANKPNTEQLLVVLQDQQEIIRIAEVGSSKAKGSDTLNYSTTVLQTVRSDQKSLLEALGKNFKVSSKVLAAKESKKTDEQLTAAEQTNRLDETVKEVLEKHMKTYRTNLRAAYDGSSSKKTKDVLQTAFNNTGHFLPTSETKN